MFATEFNHHEQNYKPKYDSVRQRAERLDTSGFGK